MVLFIKMIYICKWGAVNFSRHCLTSDLSSSIKHKELIEYRAWILFTKLKAIFPPGKQCLCMSSLLAGPTVGLCKREL